jgi:hypothetical protein
MADAAMGRRTETTRETILDTGTPLFIAGINRHFLRLSSYILLRRGKGVGLASSTSALPSAAIWKRARLSGRRFLVSAPNNGDGPEAHLRGELNRLMAKPPKPGTATV